MANTILHKRGTTTPLAASLVTGELAINTSTGAVFTKTDAGSVVNIGSGSVTWGTIGGSISSQGDLVSALALKADLAGATFSGEVFTPASTTASAGLSIAPGVAPTAPANGEIWNTGSDLQVRIGGITETLAEQSWVTAQGYITSSALTPYLLSSTASTTYQTQAGMASYALLAGGTFTGKINTPAPTTASAFLNLAHGTSPSTALDGDIWTTTSGLFVRINGAAQQFVDFANTQTINGSKTFSNANLSFGTSTAAGTINVASGATISGATKTVNVATGGASGSTTAVNIGTATSGATSTTTVNGTLTATGSTITLGNNTVASTIGLATGATTTGLTKTVNIATGALAGATTAVTIGSTTGTSTTTLNGTVNATTPAALTNTTQIATTAFVRADNNVKAWVNFDGTSTGTWPGGTSTVSRTAGSTTATVTTTTAHGLSTGNTVNALTGVAAGVYTVTVLTSTTFTITTVATTVLTAASITFAVNTIRASFNVSSVTDNAVGDYTVNFSNALPDTNYVQVMSASPNYTVTWGAGVALNHGLGGTEFAPTTTSCRFQIAGINNTVFDSKHISVAIIR